MKVEFHRTGERRYAIVVHRNPPWRMDPAAGFDELLPHDLLHFIVEKELGIRRGVFGQIADGGTAKTETAGANKRANSRERRTVKARAKKLSGSSESHADCMQSERATYICWHDWLANSPDMALRKRAVEMNDTAQSILGTMPAHEKKTLNKEFLAKMRRTLDELSCEWSALKVGQFMTVEWLESQK